jgi:predicted phosphodiesterase
MHLEEMQSALDEADGNVAAAARILGIARSTFRDRMDIYTRKDKVESKKSPSANIAEVNRLKKRLALAEDQITALRRKKKSIVGKAKAKPKGAFARVVIPDTHGCYLDKVAAKAFLEDLKNINPDEIVMLGDHLDCGGFLAMHHTMCYVAETAYTFADDVAAANEFLDRVQEAAPNATIHMLQGNHERRIEKWIVTEVVRNKEDAEFLHNLFSAEKVLHIEERGINYYVENEFHHGLRVRGAIKLGDCCFTHGISTAKHAASVTVSKFGHCIVYGHTHRIDSHTIRNVSSGVLSAWCPGCLCEIQPYYGYTNLSDWAHGYGIQFVQKDGKFLHINVPIIEGLSYLPEISLS